MLLLRLVVWLKVGRRWVGWVGADPLLVMSRSGFRRGGGRTSMLLSTALLPPEMGRRDGMCEGFAGYGCEVVGFAEPHLRGDRDGEFGDCGVE